MSKYTLFGETIEFSSAADRYIKWYQAISPAVQGARNDFVTYYENCGNISDVLDGYSKALVNITYDWAVEPLFKTLLNIGIYDINQENFEDECWDLSGAEEYFERVADAYNEIVEGLEDAKTYRAERKASRGRVVGGGFGVGGALKGMATAGAMNAVTGLGHSAVNAIGNIASSIKASSAKSSLYNNDNTLQTLARGVSDCIIDIYFAYHDFINECQDEIWFDGSGFDTEKSDTLLKNSSSVPKDKRNELLIKAFTFCPFNEDLLRHLFLNFEEERENVFKIAKKYRVDLNDDLLEVLCKRYSKDAEKICSTLKTYQPKFNDEEKEAILTAFCEKASSKPEDYEVKLSEIHEIMKILDVEESEALDDYEYDVLENIAENYENLPFGDAEEIISAIINCKVSDNTKQEYIYDSDIWELFIKYNVTIPEEEKLVLLYKKYQEMLLVKDISDEKIKKYLDELIESINFKDKSGSIPYEIKEAMFEALTGILEEKLKAEENINNLQTDLSSDVSQKVEDIISNSGIGFMTTSLTYRVSSLNDAAKSLSYCQINNDEYPFIIYDERPIMHPGEYGFCFTNKRFVGKPEYGSKYEVPVADITFFEKKGLLSSKFTLHTKNSSYEISAENLSELGKFVECLNQVLKVIPQNEKNVNDREKVLSKKVLEISVKCLDENPLLIEYFGMEDKAEAIYEKSGKNAERKRILDACTDENLSYCELSQLEEYAKAIKTLRIADEQKASISEKINSYIELIRSCKDKRTLEILDDFNDEKIDEHSLDTLIRLKAEVELHEFLDADTKKVLISKITPRLNLLTFQKKLRNAQDNYDVLVEIYSALDKELLPQDVIEQYKQQIKEDIISLQNKHLSNLLADIESKSHGQLDYAIEQAQHYNFDSTLMQKTVETLKNKLDEFEIRVLSEFCSKIESVSLEEILSFRKMIEKEGFDNKNTSQYEKTIDERYRNLIFVASCDKCKQSVISKLATEKDGLKSLLNDFETSKKDDAEISPYIQRINALDEVQKAYDKKLTDTRNKWKNQLISYVSEEITKSVLPQTRECYKPEVYIQGEKSLKEYSEFDKCKGSYAEEEFAVFYIFQLNGKNRIPNLSITNYAMYLSKSSSDGKVIRIPLETVVTLKPAKIFNNIAVNATAVTGNIYTELPYKAKECLSNAITNIIGYLVRNKVQMQQEISLCHSEYFSLLTECFEKHPIPNDDKFVKDMPKGTVEPTTKNNNVVSNTVISPQSSVSQSGNTNNTVTTEASPSEANSYFEKTISTALEGFKNGIDNLNGLALTNAITALSLKHHTVGYLAVGSDAFNKKIMKARAAYAPFGESEKLLVMEDQTVFGSAKEGFVLTDKNIYINSPHVTKNKCVALNSIIQVVNKRSSGLTDVCLSTNEGDYRVSYRSSDEEATALKNFLSELLGYIKGGDISVPSNNNTPSQTKEWICKCGKNNSGNFCSSCGTKREECIIEWQCSCGSINTTNFCPSCGKSKS